MAVYSYHQMSNEDLSKFANKVKDLISERFDIPELNECAIVVVEKGIFGKAWDKFWDKGSTNAIIQILKLVPDKTTST